MNFHKWELFSGSHGSLLMMSSAEQYTLGAETFAARKFRDFRVFWPFSQKFLPRHNLKSKFATKVFAREITENSRIAKVFSIQFFRFFKFLRCCSLITPIFSLLGYKAL